MNPKYKTVYNILDDFGDIIRVSLEKPSEEYKYVRERIKVEEFDINEIGEALF